MFCNYAGFVEPEMVKQRPCVVISKHRHNPRLVAIVPISSTEPLPVESYHIEMDPSFCAIHLSGVKCWVKCDMINMVSLDRLHLVKDKTSGLRHAPNIGNVSLNKIREAVKHVLRLI